jgi:hypothetical protein
MLDDVADKTDTECGWESFGEFGLDKVVTKLFELPTEEVGTHKTFNLFDNRKDKLLLMCEFCATV